MAAKEYTGSELRLTVGAGETTAATEDRVSDAEEMRRSWHATGSGMGFLGSAKNAALGVCEFLRLR